MANPEELAFLNATVIKLSDEARHSFSFRERDHGCSSAQGALLHDGQA